MTVNDPYAGLHAAERPRYDDPSRPDPFSGFGVVGGGSRPLPPRVRLHSDGLLRLAAVDASDPVEQASVRGLMYRVADPKAPEREFAELLLVVPRDKAVAPAADVNPCELRQDPERGAKVLDANDRAWLDTLDQTTLSDDDARVLTAWYADVDSRSERALIDRVLGPERRRHDRAAEQAQLRPVLARGTRTVPCRDQGWRKAWEDLLGERMAEEAKVALFPQLRGGSPRTPERS